MGTSGQIELLKKQRERIDSDDFDLEAWKSTTSALISRVFGIEDPRIKIIEDLKIDYGSWALRDASSKYDPVATCKRKAKDLVDMSLEELHLETGDKNAAIMTVLEDYLTGKELNEVKAVLAQKNKKKIPADLKVLLQKYKAPKLADILASILIAELE